MQKTIQNRIVISGKGLHTGVKTNIKLLPAKGNTGIKFQRVDLQDKPYITASIRNVYKTNRRTVLKENEASIETVEHLLAAIYASSIDNLIIQIDGPEIPILDGSSKIFIENIKKSGIIQQKEKKEKFEINNYFKVTNGDNNSQIEFFPQKNLEIEVTTDYKSSVISKQKAKLNQLSDFQKEIAPARTFCFLHELDQLMNHNLIKGGDLDNGIVFVEKNTSVESLGKLKKLLPKTVRILKKGTLRNVQPLCKNEQAKHKLLASGSNGSL